MNKFYNLNELVYDKINLREPYIRFEYYDVNENLIKGSYQGGSGIDGLLDYFGSRLINAIEDEAELPPIDESKSIKIEIVPPK